MTHPSQKQQRGFSLLHLLPPRQNEQTVKHSSTDILNFEVEFFYAFCINMKKLNRLIWNGAIKQMQSCCCYLMLIKQRQTRPSKINSVQCLAVVSWPVSDVLFMSNIYWPTYLFWKKNIRTWCAGSRLMSRNFSIDSKLSPGTECHVATRWHSG